MRDHLNEDHREHMLEIVHAYLDGAWATDITILSVDDTGFRAEITDGSRTERVTFAFEQPLAKPKLWRPEIIRVLRAAREELAKE